MKRSGFTMIELIFVIVILGILAAVAIPKLAATRTDAEIAKRATMAKTSLDEVGQYVVAKNYFDTNLSKMANSLAGLEKEGANAITVDAANGTATIKNISGDDCITISQGTVPFTGDSKVDSQAMLDSSQWTEAVWTDSMWKDNTKTKVLIVSHKTTNADGCDIIKRAVPPGVVSVKGRSAQF